MNSDIYKYHSDHSCLKYETFYSNMVVINIGRNLTDALKYRMFLTAECFEEPNVPMNIRESFPLHLNLRR